MRGAWVEPGPVEEALSRDEARGVLRRLWKTLRPYRGRIFVAIAVLVAQTACLLAGPWLVSIGIDKGLVPHHDAAALDMVAAVYLLVALLSLGFARLAIWMVAKVGETFLRDLRAGVFRHLLSLGLGFFETEQTGRLVSRMTSDIDALQDLVSQGLVVFVQNGLIFVGAIIAVFLLSWQLALCILVIVPPVVLASRWFRRESNRAYLEVRERIATNLATLQEGLAGVRVVQAFAGGNAPWTQRFHGTNEAQFDANLETVRISVRYFPFIEFIGVVGTAMIIGIGGLFVDQGWLAIGVVAAFVLYLNNLFEPIQQLSQLYDTVQKAGAALHKLFGLLDTRAAITERPGAVDLPARGVVEVDCVSFAYLHDDVLHDVALRIESGERLALVGPTGAGKSTLAKLLVRFYDPRRGHVRFGGIDLRDATLRSLRDRIVVVPQEGFLFAGTIRDNIRIGRAEADDADIDDAIRALGLTDRFAAMAQGLDTEVRERGSRLSAGERQLVSLARAALADPALLVLDEATSNLDPGTELAVERALERLMRGRTVVVVAHRLSTAARCDRIAVVDDGQLLEVGPHEELVDRDGSYARLFAAWTSGAAIGRTA